MKRNYESPELSLIKTVATDIITTSPGTEAPIRTDGDFIWDLDIYN